MSKYLDLVRKMACETAKCEISEPVATGACGGQAEQPQIATDSLNSQFATSQKLLVFIVDVKTGPDACATSYRQEAATAFPRAALAGGAMTILQLELNAREAGLPGERRSIIHAKPQKGGRGCAGAGWQNNARLGFGSGVRRKSGSTP
jgi:hypothetical protein